MHRGFLLIAGTCLGLATVVQIGLVLVGTARRPGPPSAAPVAVAETSEVPEASEDVTEPTNWDAADIEAVSRAHRQFNALFERLAEDLGRGEGTLSEAADRLFYYCLVGYPQHLNNIARAESQKDAKVVLAEGLLRELRHRRAEAPGSCAYDVLARLGEEMRRLRGTPGSAPKHPTQ